MIYILSSINIVIWGYLFILLFKTFVWHNNLLVIA
mgnify:CR=1 FL=1